ncbi:MULTISPECIES: GTP cyclohydrolase II [unclassified Inquilinus]|uniref:GTP cyclohydrolase II n=1 Tax=unclassified Inquilinus TaxID=2645927 RepID=UPI003F919341
MQTPVEIRNTVTIPILDGAGSGIFHTFTSFEDGGEHFAIALGPQGHDVPLVRVHSECLTGDVFGSQRCDCGPQLIDALHRIGREGGFVLYLRQEGRGIGLYAKLDAYVLQDQGLDTFEANERLNFPHDMRDFTPAAQMLLALGVKRIRLLTNNPDKAKQLEAAGIEIVEIVPTGVFVTAHNIQYLEAKVRKHAHQIDLPELSAQIERLPKAVGAGGVAALRRLGKP